GHSLGFVHAMRLKQDWGGWVAINSFPRFLDCVPASVLRDMRRRLQSNTKETLNDFYQLIDASLPAGVPDTECLIAGPDELLETDIGPVLKHQGPGLVLAGQHDPLVPMKVSEALGACGKLLAHERGGHMLPQKEPAWCARLITDFLNIYFNDHE